MNEKRKERSRGYRERHGEIFNNVSIWPMTDNALAKLKSKRWRLENLYKIVDKKKRLITFKMNPIQERYYLTKTGRYNDVLKARQFGFTTFGVIDMLDDAMWTPNFTATLLAHKQDVLDKIFMIARTAYKNMPPKLKPKLDGTGSKYEMRFAEINSKIYITLEVRGGTINRLHVSEAAFIPEERLAATYQAVPIDTGEITRETTANGLNHFYDSWNEVDDGYQKHFFPWFFNPEYQIPTAPLRLIKEEKELIETVKLRYNLKLSHAQIAFRRFKIKELKGLLNFLQEYPEDDQTCFLASGANPFDTFKLKAKYDSCPRGWDMHGEIKVFKPFDKTKSYVIGCDPAQGVKSDNSSLHVICVEDREEVAHFASNTVNPKEFAEIIKEAGRLYSRGPYWPHTIVERNNHGHAVILYLQEIRTPNLWIWEKDKGGDDEIGHLTTTVTRPLLLDTFVEAINSDMFKINSRETIGECLTLVDNKGKLEAEEGKKDDRVISMALAVKLALERLPRVNLFKNIDRKIRV